MRMESSDNRRGRYYVARANGGLTPRATQFPGALIGSFRNNSRVLSAVTDLREHAAEIAAMTHMPRRPWWTCTFCQDPWPCLDARAVLLARMSTSVLGIYMTTQLNAAAADMPRAVPGALWGRFLAWTRTDEAAVG
jgi:hypothetical protein